MYASCIIWPNSVVLHNIMLMHTRLICTFLHTWTHILHNYIHSLSVCAAMKLHACCRYRDFFCPLLAVEVWSSQTSVSSCPSFTSPTPSVFFSIYCGFCFFLSFCLYCVYHHVYYTMLDTIIQKIQLQLEAFRCTFP